MEPSNQTLHALLLEIQKQNNVDHKDIVERQKVTNHRISALENWRNLITGGLIVISAVVIPIFIKIYF